jgi:hypothetical protein
MTSSLKEKAVVGRRVTFTYYRDMDLADPPAHPGIITGTEPGYSGALLALIRLDGTRSTLHIPVAYEGLTYLDEVTEVPELPMGRFTPTPDQLEGEWEGVPICSIGEDGAVIALTDDHEKAVNAIAVYRREMAGCLYNPAFDSVDPDDVVARWAVFEWQPEDAECPWLVSWGDGVAEGDDQAVHIYHLPA